MNQISSNHVTEQKKLLEKFGGLSVVVVAVMAALLLALTLSSCSSDPFTGNWKLDSMHSDSQTLSSSDLAQLGWDKVYHLEIKADKTATYTVGEMKLDGTWEAKDGSTATFTYLGESTDMTLSDGKLSVDLGNDKTTLVFVKE